MHWYIPSFYGDITLKPGDVEGTTVIETRKVTPIESQALDKLETLGRTKNWLDPDAVIPRTGATVLRAPVEKLAKILAKEMKPGRMLVSVVKFSDGVMEEIREGNAYRTPAKPEPEKATTVAAPTRGCPAPDFVKAEIRASAVLEQFLTERQRDDFRAYNRFVAVGADTGHHYMVTSRHARDSLAQYQRSLYDLDEDRPICVHDWTIPAAEEMLTLSTLLQLSGWERWMLNLPGVEELVEDIEDLQDEGELVRAPRIIACRRVN